MIPPRGIGRVYGGTYCVRLSNRAAIVGSEFAQKFCTLARCTGDFWAPALGPLPGALPPRELRQAHMAPFCPLAQCARGQNSPEGESPRKAGARFLKRVGTKSPLSPQAFAPLRSKGAKACFGGVAPPKKGSWGTCPQRGLWHILRNGGKTRGVPLGLMGTMAGGPPLRGSRGVGTSPRGGDIPLGDDVPSGREVGTPLEP